MQGSFVFTVPLMMNLFDLFGNGNTYQVFLEIPVSRVIMKHLELWCSGKNPSL